MCTLCWKWIDFGGPEVYTILEDDMTWSRSVHYFRKWIDLGQEAYTMSHKDCLWYPSVYSFRSWIDFCLEVYTLFKTGLTWVQERTPMVQTLFSKIDLILSNTLYYFQKMVDVWSRSVHNSWTWIDFGLEVYTVAENGLTLVKNCTLWSRTDCLWYRRVYYFRTWIEVGLDVYTIFKIGLTWVQKCTLLSNMDLLWCRHYFWKWIDLGLKRYTISEHGVTSGSQVYTILEHVLTLVYQCILLPNMDLFWCRGVRYSRIWIDAGP